MNPEAQSETKTTIRVEVAKSGGEVLIVSGLATASLVNPEREGEQWAEGQRSRLKMARTEEPIVVIGVGSGFHLVALQKVKAQLALRGPLVALDMCEHSVDFSNRRWSELQCRNVDLDLGLDAFVNSRAASMWLLQGFTLLTHKPTMMRNNRLRILEDWIVGRTPEAFLAHLKHRPQIAAGLNPGRAQAVAEISRLSIRDLSKMWDISSELKPDRRYFRILEELVR